MPPATLQPLSLEKIYTTAQLNDFFRRLTEFTEKTFFTTQPAPELERALKDYPELKDLPTTFWANLTQENCYTTLTHLKKETEQLPIFNLKTAIPLSADLVAEITKWLRETTATTLLLEPSVQPSLLGGCTFVWKDNYYDYSLKAVIRQSGTSIDKLIMDGLKNGEEIP